MNEQDTYEQILDAVDQAFVDGSKESLGSLRPSFLFNDPVGRTKILSELIKQLNDCDEFEMSVAFITDSGIECLVNTFKELSKRGIKGKILTTDYLCFTDPKALDKIKQFSNVEVRMYKTGADGNQAFHTKGYIFRKGSLYRLIIGSSNITAGALTVSNEWDSELVSTDKGLYVNKVITEFNRLWDRATRLDDYLGTYRRIFSEQKNVAERREEFSPDDYRLVPNAMQVAFAQRLKEKLLQGEKRGLLISATGTGKTYAAAFALRDLNARNILFLAHRTKLLDQAIESFRRIMPGEDRYAILTGDRTSDHNGADLLDLSGDLNRYRFVFATSEMMGKKQYLERLAPQQFDFIVVDEVHKAGAPTYRKILDYFKPSFVLGMTATPDRTDDPKLIYEMFDHDVIYDIRLKDALEENILCPFHYFGITDLKDINDETYEKRDFNRLFSDRRVDYIIREAEIYGYSGDRVRGLIFVSGKEEGRILSDKLNQRGLRTVFLSGDNSEEERDKAIERLEEKEGSPDAYDYIITRDIFNEGIDIPSVNQILLLRPTQSAIVFIQQLGRGLRKHRGKEYVVIIDFIGNYEGNYNIATAFSNGSDKEDARKAVATSYIPGISTIEFDAIAKEKIYKAIQEANFNSMNDARLVYSQLRGKLNRVPSYQDFADFGNFDPERFGSLPTKTYPAFIRKVFPEDDPGFTDREMDIMLALERAVISGKRIQEPLLLKTLISGGDLHAFEAIMASDYRIKLDENGREMLVNMLNGKALKLTPLIDDHCELTADLKSGLENPTFRIWVDDVIAFAISKHNDSFSNRYRGTDFVLFKQYTRNDVSQILGWGSLQAATMFGYKYDRKTNTFPVFVNYIKDPGINEETKYEDRFLSKTVFSWVSRHGVSRNNPQMKILANWRQNGVKIYMFIRKNNLDKGKSRADHYFLGEVQPMVETMKDFRKNGKMYTTLCFRLLDEARDDIYEYLSNADIKEQPYEND